MLAKHVSRDSEIYCTTDTPLIEVFNKMTDLGCVCMPVLESPVHKNLIGTITEHDICLKIINGGLNPQRISAGRVMNGNFTTVAGDASLEDCAEILKITATERLFVIDDNGAFQGVLTEKDVVPEKPVVNLETVITEFSMPNAQPQKIQLSH